ncbi:MAG: hypothetical protein ACR65R_17300 [Methylomicrobium sp.]
MKKQIILSVILLAVCGLYSEINWAYGRVGHGGGGGGFYGPRGYGYGGGYYGHGWYGHRGGYPGHWGFGHGYYSYPGFSIYFGAPYYGYPFYGYPYYGYPSYGYPYYYPPGVVTAPSTPPVYIQQKPPVVQQYPSGYWYYCSAPQGYYPDIKECPNGWQQVQPTPPPTR